MTVVLPMVFFRLALLEQWRTHLFVIQVTVIRSMVLRVAGLSVFFYTLFKKRTSFMCWESYIGQYVYSLFLVLIVFEIVAAVLYFGTLSFLHHSNLRVVKLFPRVPAPRFDTINSTIGLIYAQTIIFFGSFFCPLLPLLGVLRCFLLFYVKKFLTLTLCHPPVRAFRARFSFSELFSTVLLIMLFLMAFPLGYAVTRIAPSGAYATDTNLDRWIKLPSGTQACSASNVSCTQCLSPYVGSAPVCWRPSLFKAGATVAMDTFCQACPSGCGPFRNQALMLSVVMDEVESWSGSAIVVLQFVASTSFAVLLVIVLIIVALYIHAHLRAKDRLADRMRMERDLERVDKLWILQHVSSTLKRTT